VHHVNAELRRLHSPDLDDGEVPADPSRVCIAMQALIGPRGARGEESFAFTVVTEESLAQLGRPRWGRGLLIVDSFSWEGIKVAVEKLLRHCSGGTWSEVANSINRFLQWEFDEYQGT